MDYFNCFNRVERERFLVDIKYIRSCYNRLCQFSKIKSLKSSGRKDPPHLQVRSTLLLRGDAVAVNPAWFVAAIKARNESVPREKYRETIATDDDRFDDDGTRWWWREFVTAGQASSPLSSRLRRPRLTFRSKFEVSKKEERVRSDAASDPGDTNSSVSSFFFLFFLLQSFQQNALRHLNTGVPSVFSPKITKIGSKYKKSKKKTFSKCFSRNPIKEIKSATNNIRLVPIFVVIKRTSYTLITPEQV